MFRPIESESVFSQDSEVMAMHVKFEMHLEQWLAHSPMLVLSMGMFPSPLRERNNDLGSS